MTLGKAMKVVAKKIYKKSIKPLAKTKNRIKLYKEIGAIKKMIEA
jgi:hypothetical protein